MSLACQVSIQRHHFMNNWYVWQNDLNSLSDLGQPALLQCAPESRGMHYNTEIRSSLCVGGCISLSRRVQITPSSAVFNQISNPGLECQGFIFTEASIILPSLCYCLHSRNHTQSAKILLLMHEREQVWVCLLHRGKVRREWNTLPEAMTKLAGEELLCGKRLVGAGFRGMEKSTISLLSKVP